MNYTFDPAEIRRAVETFIAPGQVFELRALDCKLVGEYRKGTLSGYFDREHVDELLAAIGRIESAAAVYYTPNPVDPRLHARAENHARIITDKTPVTSDNDIVRRRWLLIDVDPTRPAGISASDEEKAFAAEMVTAVDYHLWEMGFPPGVFCDSGNGSHLLVPINLPAKDGGFVTGLLQRLAKEFDNEHCKIDQTVFNPARIWKLPGTLSCKGDSTKSRPWRIARIGFDCREVAA